MTYEIADDNFTSLIKNSSRISLRILTLLSRSSICRRNPSYACRSFSSGRCSGGFVYSESTASATFSDAAVARFGGNDVCAVSTGVDEGWEPSRDWSRALDIVDERWISGVDESCRCWDGVVLDVVVVVYWAGGVCGR